MILASIFRDSEEYLDRYFKQVIELKEALRARGEPLTCLWLEGDSVDGTRHKLRDFSDVDKALIIRPTGKPNTTRLWNRERWPRIAECWNALLHDVDWMYENRFADEKNFILIVESDLIWNASDVMALYDGLDAMKDPRTVVAAGLYCYHGYPWNRSAKTEQFFDTHGFRRGDIHFQNDPPYWPAFGALEENEKWVEVTTAGGMMLAHLNCMDGATFAPRDCVMHWPPDVRVWMSKDVKVWHPPVWVPGKEVR